jgi:hypothetical protein
MVGASLDEQLRGLLLPGLVRSSLGRANRQTRDLGQQVSAPYGQLGDAGQDLRFLGVAGRSASRVPFGIDLPHHHVNH